VFSNTAHQKAL